MEPLLASLCFYVYVIVLCRLAVHFCRRQLASPDQLAFAVEFFGTLQVCACCFENGAFLHFYGWPGFWLVLTVMAFVHSVTTAAVTNPAITIEDGIRAKTSPRHTLLMLLAQLAGGMLAYRFNLLFWSLGLHEVHAEKYQTYACFTDLNVGLLAGIACETLAATLAQMVDCWLAARYDRHPAAFGLSAACATITCIGLHVTGMYYNPILASALTLGCDGLDNRSHWVIYWLGPCVGQLLGTELHVRLDHAHKQKIV